MMHEKNNSSPVDSMPCLVHITLWQVDVLISADRQRLPLVTLCQLSELLIAAWSSAVEGKKARRTADWSVRALDCN